MKRIAAAALFAALACCLPAAAEEDDGIFGNYIGTYASGGEAAAKIISHELDRFVGRMDTPKGDVKLEGRKIDGVVTLKSVDGAAAKVAGTIKDGVFSGTVDGAAFETKRTFIESPTLGMAPPEGAVVLFDGTHMDEWMRWPEKWPMTDDGGFQVSGSNLVTKRMFGDATYHIEFMTPFMPKERGQGRGNSGFYIQGRYEVQILDSFGEDPAWDYCGGFYKQSVPSTNASLPPLQWQTYDIDFTAPKFDANNVKTANARVTVRHNGVVIHDDLELIDRTPGGMGGGELPVERILLQDHGDGVKFRNIWVVEKK